MAFALFEAVNELGSEVRSEDALSRYAGCRRLRLRCTRMRPERRLYETFENGHDAGSFEIQSVVRSARQVRICGSWGVNGDEN